MKYAYRLQRYEKTREEQRKCVSFFFQATVFSFPVPFPVSHFCNSAQELQIDDREVRFARDLFLFSFYTRGMSFVDIAYLQHSDVKDGILTYKRRKTGQQLTVSWEASMQEIVDEYSQSGHSPYLLPIIKKRNGKERNQYRHVQALVNSHLKTIAQMAGINCKLTMYCARHSWASIARQLDIPMRVISRGMGHDNELTTEIYLKSVDSQSVDQANREIISLVRG